MKQRLITAALILGATIPLVLLSQYITYPIALSILAFIAVHEILRTLSLQKKYSLAIPAYMLALAMPFSAYFAVENGMVYLLSLSALVFAFLMYTMAVGVFSKGRLGFSVISELFVMVAYVVISFSSMALIRYVNMDVGLYVLILVLVVSWVTDSCAYIVGSLFGKHKLIPEVSPKKTVEGAIGGVVFAALFCLIYGFLVDIIFCGMTLNVFGTDIVFANINVNYIALALMGIILPVVSQLGDLTASLIKREYGVKDYGKIFPGHGGIMDRFDSVIAVSTILLIICVAFPPFVLI